MNISPLVETLKTYGIFSRKEYYGQAFSRNLGLLTRQEQGRLAQARIGIPGMGGVGGNHLMTMVRTGVGHFHISDFDMFEPANINRQFGARVPDFGRPKMTVMKEQALSVNPFITIKEFHNGIGPDTVDEFLDGLDVVIDSLDFFAFDARRLLFTRAREKGIHVITAGPLGFSAAMLVFAPDQGMGFDAYFNIVDGMNDEDRHLAFALGLAPKALQFKYMDTAKVSLKSGKGPSLNIACQLCAGLAGTEAVKIILKRGKIRPVPYYVQFDPYINKYMVKKLHMGNRHPWQRVKMAVVKHMINKNAVTGPQEAELPCLSSAQGLSTQALEYIIRAGIQAPSGDNCQPWKFRRDSYRICLYLNEDADHSFFNVNQAASIISCGASLENMRLAATKLGLKADIRYAGQGEKIADIVLTKASGQKKEVLADMIWKRHTNRKLFKKIAPPVSLLERLSSCIKDIGGTHVHFVTDPGKLSRVADLVSRADRIRTERRDLHEHLNAMLRLTVDEAMEKRDGFYIKNLEAGPEGEFFLKATKYWPMMNIANHLGMGRIVAAAAHKGIIHASGVGLITVDGTGRDHLLNGGRALERIWLSLTHAGFQFQPMTAVTLFFLRRRYEGDKEFSAAHAKMLEKIKADYARLFSVPGLDRKGQVMLFRFGLAENMRYGTMRQHLKKFII